jgi:hypothetical protein
MKEIGKEIRGVNAKAKKCASQHWSLVAAVGGLTDKRLGRPFGSSTSRPTSDTGAAAAAGLGATYSPASYFLRARLFSTWGRSHGTVSAVIYRYNQI